MKKLFFSLQRRKHASKPYHYKESGLDNVFLRNGFTLHETPYGKGLSIDNLDGLHRAIGRLLICKSGRLSPQELRYLRNDLGMTQTQFARLLDSEEQNIGRYERGESPIPGPVDVLTRCFYFTRTCSKKEHNVFHAFMIALQAAETNEIEPELKMPAEIYMPKDIPWQPQRAH